MCNGHIVNDFVGWGRRYDTISIKTEHKSWNAKNWVQFAAHIMNQLRLTKGIVKDCFVARNTILL